jgi:uncharacterized protein (TIGR02679 family)
MDPVRTWETAVEPTDGLVRLGRAGLEPVLAELARRFGDGAAPVAITLRDLAPGQRQAVADLLGLDRLPPPTFRLVVRKLFGVLGIEHTDELRVMVEHLRGPIVDRRAESTARRSQVRALWDRFEAEAVGITPPGPAPLDPWITAVRSAGIRGGISEHQRRLSGALAVLRNLPVADGITLASLAADVLHDAHALDRGRSVTLLVLDAVAVTLGRERAADAESARLLWEEVGVVPDLLSSTVLTLGLRPGGDDPLAISLRAMTDAGEPVVLTLAQLRRWPVDPLPSGAAAFVFENPALIAEAAAGGWEGPPLVCSSGRPTVAVVTLLRQLGAAGSTIFQHADFDPAGLGITAWLADRARTRPWRMSAADYRAACATRPAAGRVSTPVPSTPWDSSLRAAMESDGSVIHEEQLRATLLGAASDHVHVQPGGGWSA